MMKREGISSVIIRETVPLVGLCAPYDFLEELIGLYDICSMSSE